jgi:hypothetical protein
MDPNETLKRIRELRNDIQNGDHLDDYLAERATELAELIGALDGHLSHGGYLPKAWRYGGVPGIPVLPLNHG